MAIKWEYTEETEHIKRKNYAKAPMQNIYYAKFTFDVLEKVKKKIVKVERKIEIVYKAREINPNEDEFLISKIKKEINTKDNIIIKKVLLIKNLGKENQVETKTLKAVI